MRTASERNRRLFSGLFGAAYAAYIERERVSRLVARVVWGSDIRPYYSSMRAVSDLPDGSTVVDCPCGAGVALRTLRPDQQVRYLGFDIAPAMLARACRRAEAAGLRQPTFEEANATSLPLANDTANLFLSYFGLHCFDDPEAALREAGRCLRPGGRLVGSTIVRGARTLDRLRVRPHVGGFGEVSDEAGVDRWLRSAGFQSPVINTDGIFTVFSTTKGDPPSAG